MKTSLICLLLLAAVACAAPQPGEKRVGMAGKMREMMAEKRKENLVADAKFDVEAESRSESCSGPCHELYGKYYGCFDDSCNTDYDELYDPSSSGCKCCWNDHDSCPT